MEQVLRWLVPFLLGGLAAAVGKLFGGMRALRAGTQALLRDRLVQAYNHHMDRGFCPIYARENVEALYRQYHALGGNGTVTGLVEQLMRLPTEIRNTQEDKSHDT